MVAPVQQATTPYHVPEFNAVFSSQQNLPMMSVLGQTQKSKPALPKSAIPSTADIGNDRRHVSFVPKLELFNGLGHISPVPRHQQNRY